MAIPGLSLSGLLEAMQLGLSSIEEVQHVQMGWPSIEEVPAYATPAIFYGWEGADWTPGHVRCYVRKGTMNLAIIAGGADQQEAIDSVVLLQERVKAWLFSNQLLASPLTPSVPNVEVAVIIKEGPLSVVGKQFRMRSDLTLRLEWMESTTNMIGRPSQAGTVGVV